MRAGEESKDALIGRILERTVEWSAADEDDPVV